MSGCYGDSAYDRWLEARQDEYWSRMLVDDEDEQEPTATERREEAAEAEADRRRDERYETRD
jgi:hypothetical protein